MSNGDFRGSLRILGTLHGLEYSRLEGDTDMTYKQRTHGKDHQV